MPMTKRGSQTREPIAETDQRVVGTIHENMVVLVDDDNKFELWHKNDNFAGYVVEIDGEGYEFVRTARWGDLWWADINDKPQDVVLMPM